uniref:UPAR/Ly6 domain-containing protein n=1 Tax=Anabas testudineus TaxID=64144 RepID=A0A3Q1HAC5_ANATE
SNKLLHKCFNIRLFQKEELLQCFRCDLGLWGACYTTETNCSRGERCYTGQGRAADVLDIKTLGCVKAEECEVETTVEVFPSQTVFVLTRHCCDTPFCNMAHKDPIYTFLYLTVAFLIIWTLH